MIKIFGAAFLLGRLDVINCENACICLVAANSTAELVSFLLLYIVYRVDIYGESGKASVDLTKRVMRYGLPVAASAYLRSALTTAENFGETMSELAHEHLDITEVENLIDELRKRLRQGEFMKNKLELKQLQLDATDKYFDQKYETLDRQLESVYETIAETSAQLMEAESQLESIKRQGLTIDSIYESLKVFNRIYDRMTDYEKKIFLRSFIDKIELYPDKSRKHGCFIKSIDFLFPVSYNGERVYQINLPENSVPNESHVETIVLLSTEKVDAYIPVHLNVEQLGEIPHTPEKFEQNKEKPQSAKLQTFGTATYHEIKKYCFEVHGLKVHSAHIAELKSKYGIKERKNYYLPKEGSQHRKYPCTAERKAAILDAFKHFGMI
jgi:site-specific DNA recombinase